MRESEFLYDPKTPLISSLLAEIYHVSSPPLPLSSACVVTFNGRIEALGSQRA